MKKEDLSIAFSTRGAFPEFAKQIRQHFENLIPENVGAFLSKKRSLRMTMPKEKERMQYFDTLVKEYFRKHFK